MYNRGGKQSTDPVSTTLGPNTNALPSVLHEQCIYCAGEDRRELLQALAEAGPAEARERVKDYFQRQAGAADARVAGKLGPDWCYRSYEFWRFRDFCLVLSGIGTGCLEPLLFEVLRASIVRKIILIGTAGRMPEGKAQLGKAYVVGRAWPAATGIDAEVAELPLVPRWKLATAGNTASAVSSDFYYGFAPDVLTGEYPIHHGPLKALYEEHLRRKTDLVEMEVAQFYFFCKHFGGDGLEYVAVKAAANAVGRGEQQGLNSGHALRSTLVTAFRLLRIPA